MPVKNQKEYYQRYFPTTAKARWHRCPLGHLLFYARITAPSYHFCEKCQRWVRILPDKMRDKVISYTINMEG